MTCEEAEKTILYFYGELDGSARDRMARHISACPSCSAQIAALTKAGLYLKSAEIGLPKAIAEKVLELAGDMRPRGFLEVVACDWRRIAAASALALVFAIGFASTGYKNASWKNDIGSGLDAVEYNICQLQEENSSLWQADFDYKYSDLESKANRLKVEG